MNYYEELGLDPLATHTEIRRAYKEMARLLHPDRQKPESRHLAEYQMKRLNGIMAVLSDPKRRGQYDAGLANKNPKLVTEYTTRRVWTRPQLKTTGVWITTGIVALAGLFWFLDLYSKSPPRPAVLAKRSLLEPQIKASGLDLKQVSARTNRTRAIRKFPTAANRGDELLVPEPEASSEYMTAPVPKFKSAAPQGLALSFSAMLPNARLLWREPEPAGAQAPNVIWGYDGTWFYPAGRPKALQSGQYWPEYIEARMRENAGMLRGRYRARYRIPDRAIPPDVQFKFEGRVHGQTAELEWRGTGGSQGELRLKLLSESAMELNWWATDLGAWLGLASGSAVLIRRQER